MDFFTGKLLLTAELDTSGSSIRLSGERFSLVEVEFVSIHFDRSVLTFEYVTFNSSFRALTFLFAFSFSNASVLLSDPLVISNSL